MSPKFDSNRYDPRLGDESENEGPTPAPARSERHVRLEEHPTFEEYTPQIKREGNLSESSSDSETTKKADSTASRKSIGKWVLEKSPIDLHWIPDNWKWSKIKPLIRCAIVAWVSVLFFVVKRLEILLGQVSVRHRYSSTPASL